MENENLEPASDFYFWAASNASTDTFPTNKPQKFRNKFAQSLALGNGWEIALCEVYYPNNYHFNTEKLKEEAIFSLLYGDTNPAFYERKVYKVAAAIYTTDESIAGAINSVLKAANGKDKPGAQIQRNTNAGRWELVSEHVFSEIFFENEAAQYLFWQLGFGQLQYYANGYGMKIPIGAKHEPVYSEEKKSATVLYFDAKKNYVNHAKLTGVFNSEKNISDLPPVLSGEKLILKLKYGKDTTLGFSGEYRDTYVRFANQESANLFKSLGFYGYNTDPGVFTLNQLPILAADPVLSIAQRPALFIYCDKIEYQLVGDTRAPLLLTVPVETPWDRPVVWIGFQRLTYVPIRSGYINDIEFAITDDQGNPVQFKGGKVILKLHFRKIR